MTTRITRGRSVLVTGLVIAALVATPLAVAAPGSSGETPAAERGALGLDQAGAVAHPGAPAGAGNNGDGEHGRALAGDNPGPGPASGLERAMGQVPDWVAARLAALLEAWHARHA